jgi:hypothetical protein
MSRSRNRSLSFSVGLALLLAAAPAGAGDLFDEIAPSLVKVRAYMGSELLKDASGLMREDFEHGTGFTVEDSLVITAKHTLQSKGVLARSIQCWSNQRGRYEGCSVLYASPTADIAVLWYPGGAKSQLKLRTGDVAPVGALIMAGYPDVSFTRPRMMLTRGNVVAWRTSAPGAAHVPERKNLASSDVLAYPGCSGAPLLASDHTVAGMVVSAIENDEGEWSGETYFVHATDLSIALAVARKSIVTKKGYEFLEPH